MNKKERKQLRKVKKLLVEVAKLPGTRQRGGDGDHVRPRINTAHAIIFEMLAPYSTDETK